jgi:hypothetical protein
MCNLFSIKHVQAPAYHPQANGAIERLHRPLKGSQRAHLASADWYHHLPWTLLAMRAATRDDSALSPAELLYGTQLVLPGQFVSAADLLRAFVDASLLFLWPTSKLLPPPQPLPFPRPPKHVSFAADTADTAATAQPSGRPQRVRRPLFVFQFCLYGPKLGGMCSNARSK